MNVGWFFKKWPTTYFLKKSNYYIKHFYITLFSVNNEHKRISSNYLANSCMYFSYKLDYFQKISIKCILKNQNIIVATHTSSGKTSVAEYIITNCLYCNKKIIYTSPLKALSNQKFRDLFNLFSVKIGLITGDISVNFDGNCIIMTTEILRLLFYESYFKNIFEWIVLDEIHYIKDKKRGFVWEEILILIPMSIKIICLSATISNVREFTEWIVDTKKISMHILQTSTRIVSLQHYISFYFDLKLYLITNQQGIFDLKKFKKIFGAIGLKKKNKIKKVAKNKIKKIIQKIHKIHYWPIIVFAFKKKKCFVLLYRLKKNFFCNKFEKNIISLFFKKCFGDLDRKAKKIFRLKHIFYFFKKGLGIHHSDILPLIREITEILFQVSLLKILCATETFSIGLNMPAKTILFLSLKKFDGKNLRMLNRSEFIQMGGRAGRRGLDVNGVVISLISKHFKKKRIKKIFKEIPEPIVSKFQNNVSTVIKNSTLKNRVNRIQNKKSFLEYQIYLFTIKNTKSLVQVKKRKDQLIVPSSFLFSHLFNIDNLYKSFKWYFYYTFNFKEFFNDFFYKNQLYLTHLLSFVLKTSNKLVVSYSFFLTMEYTKTQNQKRECFSILLIGFLSDSSIKGNIANLRGRCSYFFKKFSLFFLKMLIVIDGFFFIKKPIKKNFELLSKNFRFIIRSIREKKYIHLKYKVSIQKNLKKVILNLNLLNIISLSGKLTLKGLACNELNFEDNILLIELLFSKKINDIPVKKFFSLIGIFFSKNLYLKPRPCPNLIFGLKAIELVFKKLQNSINWSILNVSITQYIGKVNMTMSNFLYNFYKNINFLYVKKRKFFKKEIFLKNFKKLVNLFINLSRISEKLGNINISSRLDACSLRIKKYLYMINESFVY